MKEPLDIRILKALGRVLMVIGTAVGLVGDWLVMAGAVLVGPGEPVERGKQ